mmetsp:Transcript_42990/g.106029  ORF Transcript_42990/g.106029 Transcript_42990/m.106029 type:complete len:278 (-) Transcript_42990:576-1409(-)
MLRLRAARIGRLQVGHFLRSAQPGTVGLRRSRSLLLRADEHEFVRAHRLAVDLEKGLASMSQDELAHAAREHRSRPAARIGRPAPRLCQAAHGHAAAERRRRLGRGLAGEHLAHRPGRGLGLGQRAASELEALEAGGAAEQHLECLGPVRVARQWVVRGVELGERGQAEKRHQRVEAAAGRAHGAQRGGDGRHAALREEHAARSRPTSPTLVAGLSFAAARTARQVERVTGVLGQVLEREVQRGEAGARAQASHLADRVVLHREHFQHRRRLEAICE